jgi:hypothetical protein
MHVGEYRSMESDEGAMSRRTHHRQMLRKANRQDAYALLAVSLRVIEADLAPRIGCSDCTSASVTRTTLSPKAAAISSRDLCLVSLVTFVNDERAQRREWTGGGKGEGAQTYGK